MIRYSNSRSAIRLTNPNALTELFSPAEKEYRELLDLREQVKKAEAAAKRLGPRGKNTQPQPVRNEQPEPKRNARPRKTRPAAKRTAKLKGVRASTSHKRSSR